MAGVSWQDVELLDREAVRRAVATLRPSRVYHCAGAAHVARAWHETERTLAANVRGTHHLIEALRDAGIDARVLITGSAFVYAPSDAPIGEDHPLVPSSPYGLSKLAQEMLARDADGPVVLVARAFNHFGPRQDPSFATASFAQRIAAVEAGRDAPELRVGNLSARRDLTDVRDTVRAYRTIMERGVAGRPYNVCSGQAIMIGDLLDRLLVRARVPITTRVDPALYRPADHPLIVGDRTRITSELGWAPIVPLEQSLDDLLDYWRRRESSAG